MFPTGTYCSHVPPGDLVSDGNKLHISFSSNEKVVDTSFTLTWRAVDPTEAPCGGRFSSNQGEITSPNWPSDYHAQSVVSVHLEVYRVHMAHQCCLSRKYPCDAH
ncbi:hypothetical protein ILYODFUR_005315 [Ilyodon furcidens]|uniref:CUB domain-containing protein n=1 Tax=Ilyodon furcidens TaxID=33524 RepID=A0ABV0TT82_9TELE